MNLKSQVSMTIVLTNVPKRLQQAHLRWIEERMNHLRLTCSTSTQSGPRLGVN